MTTYAERFGLAPRNRVEIRYSDGTHRVIMYRMSYVHPQQLLWQSLPGFYGDGRVHASHTLFVPDTDDEEEEE